MPCVYLQSEIHRSISWHQPQRRRASSRYPEPDQAKKAAVHLRRGERVFTSTLVQVQRCGPSEYEGQANVHMDLWQRGFEIQKL